MTASLVLTVVCACGAAVFAGEAGVRSSPDASAAAPDKKAKPQTVAKTATFYYGDASGKQTLVVSFLPKRRLGLTITRDRSDGCHWSKELTARFVDVESYSLPDGDTTEVDEYKIEPKQMTCPMFLDIEKDTKAFADITTTRCASECKLSGDAVMRPRAN
jgi:hypothetical protein